MSDTTPHELDIRFTATKGVPPDDVRHARDVVARALAHAPRPVLYAKVTLSVLHDPAVPRPHPVSLRVDLNGRPVTAHAEASSMQEAISLAAARLRTRVEDTAQYRETRRRPPRHANVRPPRTN